MNIQNCLRVITPERLRVDHFEYLPSLRGTKVYHTKLTIAFKTIEDACKRSKGAILLFISKSGIM